TLPARTVCVAAGTGPNTTVEKEAPGRFEVDPEHSAFSSFRIENGKLVPAEVTDDLTGAIGFFTSHSSGGRYVSFFGDNHPAYAGSVVKAMASAKDGYPHVVGLFPELATLDAAEQPARDRRLADLFARLDAELLAHVVAVNRLTQTIVEVVVHAPLAARKF